MATGRYPRSPWKEKERKEAIARYWRARRERCLGILTNEQEQELRRLTEAALRREDVLAEVSKALEHQNVGHPRLRADCPLCKAADAWMIRYIRGRGPWPEES